MAKEKKVDKSLPRLIFLIGLALIIGGALMQIGYFDTSTQNPTPESKNSSDDQTVTEDVATADSEDSVEEVDFSNTVLVDNEALPVKQGIEYTYGTDFKMSVVGFNVSCDSSNNCGSDGDSISVNFTTTTGQSYPITLTPSENSQNLIDVPVTVTEWHSDYVMLMLTR